MIFCFPPGFDASAYKTMSVLRSTKNCPSKHLTMIRLTMLNHIPLAPRPGKGALRKLSISAERHMSVFAEVLYWIFMKIAMFS